MLSSPPRLSCICFALHPASRQVQNERDVSLSWKSKNPLRDLSLHKTSWGCFFSFHLYCGERRCHANSALMCACDCHVLGSCWWVSLCVCWLSRCVTWRGTQTENSNGSRNCHSLLPTWQRLPPSALAILSLFSSLFFLPPLSLSEVLSLPPLPLVSSSASPPPYHPFNFCHSILLFFRPLLCLSTSRRQTALFCHQPIAVRISLEHSVK